MDWTGGTRRRFAPGKNNAILQKQKAHFAKARSALQHPPSSHRLFEAMSHGTPKSESHYQSGLRERVSSHTRRDPSPERLRQTHISESGKTQARASADVGGSGRPTDIDRRFSSASNSHRHSPRPTSAHGDTGATASAQHHAHKPHADAMDEEQKLLIANRRRLLARPDWLGLSASRPVRLNFSSRRDKDRIGKRRIVAGSTSRKGQPAARRLLTPLFEQRLLSREHLMSGALPDEQHIHVKIGTDALASQTQHTRQSQTRRLETARRPSTDLGPLSEEPMLLGDDGDGFDAIQSLPGQDDHHDPHEPQVVTPLNHQSSVQHTGWHQATDDRDPDSHLLTQYLEVPQMIQYGAIEHYPGQSATRKEVEMDHGSGSDREDGFSGENRQKGSVTPEFARQHPTLSRHMRSSDEGNDDVDEAKRAAREMHDDEAFWRRLMRFEERTATDPSIEAVASSSLHATASDQSLRPVLPQTMEHMFEPSQVPSTPKGAGTLGSILRSAAPSATSDSILDLLSPSASLARIRKLTEPPVRRAASPPALQSKEADEDAIWRDFIIGSQDSTIPSPRHGRHTSMDDSMSFHASEVEGQRGTAMSMLDMSGLRSSVEAIAARTQDDDRKRSRRTRTRQASESPQYDRRHPNSQRALTLSRSPTSRAQAVKGSMTDEIEDPQPEPAPRSRSIIPVRSGVLNPKRFKSTKRNIEAVSSRTPPAAMLRKVSKRTKTRTSFRPYSIYDLVDSEGASPD